MPRKKSENHPTTKYPIQDTPEKERHIGIIVEDYDSKLALVLENLDTIKRDVSKDLDFFRDDTKQKFALQDYRFALLENKIEKLDLEIQHLNLKKSNF